MGYARVGFRKEEKWGNVGYVGSEGMGANWAK